MTMSDSKTLTKKQLKAQEFRKTRKQKDKETEVKKRSKDELDSSHQEPLIKKRKTRRGKGGKGKEKSGNRFIIFVGNLPEDVTPSELQAHFKSSSPDEIRIRKDKRIAFLEFNGEKDSKNIQSRMDIALLQSKTMLKDKKINVELTVGGGGNSHQRLEKLKQKNEMLNEERYKRLKDMVQDKKKKNGESKDFLVKQELISGIHPDRVSLIR